MDWIDIIATLLSLTALEIVLGIDNIVFLSIISQRLPSHQQPKARRLGLTFAWVTRLMLLASAVWLTTLTTPLFSVLEQSFSVRDLFMLFGGLFLMFKAVKEMHAELEPSFDLEMESYRKGTRVFWLVIAQIAVVDIVFSLDSILTAISLTNQLWVMAIAITLAIIAMVFASEVINSLIERHPTIKMIALSFVLLIGVLLIADGFQYHIARGYLYFAMAFSIFVESLNIVRAKRYQRLDNRKITRGH